MKCLIIKLADIFAGSKFGLSTKWYKNKFPTITIKINVSLCLFIPSL